jgi:CheY-like chemotaxis protein
MLFRTIGTTVRIETVLTQNLWPALVDSTQIELVLLNLAINARDAMPNGGRLTIRTTNLRRGQAPGCVTPGDYVLISVADTGEGMTSEVLSKAIEPFFTTKEIGKGSGLGLIMVHGVATQSGGGLLIDSHVGRGTTVNVFLPRARRSSAATREVERRSASARSGATILVVDDDADVREVTLTSLENFGYRVMTAENGPAALDALVRADQVDLLIVDMAMPGMSGVELISRARERRPELRAMLVTGYADLAAFSPAESDLILQKPYRLERLASSVIEALRSDPRKSKSNVVPIKPTRKTLKSR